MNLIKISIVIRQSAEAFATKRLNEIIVKNEAVQLQPLLEEAYIRGADEALTRYVGKGKLPGEIGT